MAAKENFVKALKELTGTDDDDRDMAKMDIPMAGRRKAEPITIEFDSIDAKEPEKAAVKFPWKTEKFSEGAETRITKSMLIKGDIIGSGSVDIMGRVEGNLKSDGNVAAGGVIVGDAHAVNIAVFGDGILKGEVSATGRVDIGRNSIVMGNVTADSIRIDGKVKGDLFIKGLTELTESALVSGNIETAAISTDRGSRIKGSIITKITADADVESEFDIEV